MINLQIVTLNYNRINQMLRGNRNKYNHAKVCFQQSEMVHGKYAFNPYFHTTSLGN